MSNMPQSQGFGQSGRAHGAGIEAQQPNTSRTVADKTALGGGHGANTNVEGAPQPLGQQDRLDGDVRVGRKEVGQRQGFHSGIWASG